MVPTCLNEPTSIPAKQFYELLVIGGSAGGIPALQLILSCLSATFPIPIVIVQHLSAREPSRLAEVLARFTRLQCRWAQDGDVPHAGSILVAPPGGSLMLTSARVLRRTDGSKPPLGWPSIDLLLQSAAMQFGPRLIAVVLSGVLRDGSAGILAVRRSGGATIAQDYRSATFSDMPAAAVEFGRADLMLPVEQIGGALQILAERDAD